MEQNFGPPHTGQRERPPRPTGLPGVRSSFHHSRSPRRLEERRSAKLSRSRRRAPPDDEVISVPSAELSGEDTPPLEDVVEAVSAGAIQLQRPDLGAKRPSPPRPPPPPAPPRPLWLVMAEVSRGLAERKATQAVGWPVLVQAAFADDMDGVRSLLNARADANALTSNRASALWYAVLSGNLGIVRLLVDAKADVNIVSRTSRKGPRRALLDIASNHSSELVRLLQAAGAESWARAGGQDDRSTPGPCSSRETAPATSAAAGTRELPHVSNQPSRCGQPGNSRMSALDLALAEGLRSGLLTEDLLPSRRRTGPSHGGPYRPLPQSSGSALDRETP